MTPLEGENSLVKVRLVGNVTGTVYAEGEVQKETLYKDPDLYLGYAHLAIPFYPSVGGEGSGSGPALDPDDTQLILQARAASDNTAIGNTGEGGGNSLIGHWQGTIEERPGAVVEIPNGLAT